MNEIILIAFSTNYGCRYEVFEYEIDIGLAQQVNNETTYSDFFIRFGSASAVRNWMEDKINASPVIYETEEMREKAEELKSHNKTGNGFLYCFFDIPEESILESNGFEDLYSYNLSTGECVKCMK